MRSLLLRAVLLALVVTVAPRPFTTEILEIPEVATAKVAVTFDAATVPVSGNDQSSNAALSPPTAAPHPFTMVGFELPDGVDELQVRTKDPSGTWSEWFDLARVSSEDGPDPGSAEAASDRSRRFTEAAWVGESDQFQVRVPGDGAEAELSELEATVLDTDGLAGGPVERKRVTVSGPVAEAATQPPIVSRAQWGALAPRSGASYASKVDMTVVHHTAGSNSYTRAQAAGRVRGYQAYHRNTLGWKDIGYNVLVDRYGTVYEGRDGGLTRGVIGAHASGYNSGSFGVTVMGNFTSVDAPQAAYDALARVIAWKASLHGFNPSGATSRYAGGRRLPVVIGHRDVGQTSCPGLISNRLWWIRQQAASQTAPTTRLYDVPTSSTHRDNVLALDDAGIIKGYADNTFRPGRTLTRAQMATVVARALGLRAVQPDGQFKDVTSATGHAGNIHAVAKAGIVRGYGDGTFRPGEPVRRDQMAAYLSRALKLTPRAAPFADVPSTSTHHGYVGAIAKAGITNGGPGGLYRPDEHLRRDQAASMIARAFVD